MAVREMVVAGFTDLAARVRRLEELLLLRRLSPYGVAVSRVLSGSAYVGILLTNFTQREILFGTASDWARGYRETSAQAPWLGMLENVSGPVFTLFYLAVIAAGVAFVLGWHARIAGVLMLFGAVQVLEMNPLVSDQGDNILRVGIFFVLLTECSAVWSLDARRRARRELPRDNRWTRFLERPAVTTSRTLLHNGAVIGLAIQLVIVYVAAAMYKIPGNGWRYGTAIASPLRGDEYRVWPWLNDLVVSSGIGVWLMTYAAVYLQLYFPALLLNKITRRFALAAVILLHLGIAVLMGLPWFTLGMVAFDGIFVSTTTYQSLQQFAVPHLRAGRARIAHRLARAS